MHEIINSAVTGKMRNTCEVYYTSWQPRSETMVTWLVCKLSQRTGDITSQSYGEDIGRVFSVRKDTDRAKTERCVYTVPNLHSAAQSKSLHWNGIFGIAYSLLKPWFHVIIKLLFKILVFYFNTEPRLKWNKIVLAAKKNFISDVVPCWNKIISKNFRPEPPPQVTHTKTFYFISDVVPC